MSRIAGAFGVTIVFGTRCRSDHIGSRAAENRGSECRLPPNPAVGPATAKVGFGGISTISVVPMVLTAMRR